MGYRGIDKLGYTHAPNSQRAAHGGDGARRTSPVMLIEIPHLWAWSL
jgi:hypothetical protein